MAKDCRRTNAVLSDFTAAHICFTNADGKSGGHEWLIEFEKEPENHNEFKETLDNTLKSLNSDYEAKRHKDIALKPPRIHVMPRGAFHNWLKAKGKLGGQHKVPRLSNDRNIVEEILSFTAN